MTKIILNSSKEKLYEVKTTEYIPYIDLLDEWIKFSSITSSEELKLSNFSNSDSPELTAIRRIQRMNYIFKKYKDKNCNDEEYDEAQEYMNSSITKFIDTRLSDEDRNYAKKFASKIQEESDEIIKDYILANSKKYSELSLVNAYILRIVINNYLNKLNDECSEKIINETKERNISLKKSLIRDYGLLFYK